MLRKRYVTHPRLEDLDKPSLVKLYTRTVLPLPQREYVQNRTGKRLSALQDNANRRHQKEADTKDNATTLTRSNSAEKKRKGSLNERIKPSPGQSSQKDGKSRHQRTDGSGDEAWGTWDPPSAKSRKVSETTL